MLICVIVGYFDDWCILYCFVDFFKKGAQRSSLEEKTIELKYYSQQHQVKKIPKWHNFSILSARYTVYTSTRTAILSISFELQENHKSVSTASFENLLNSNIVHENISQFQFRCRFVPPVFYLKSFFESKRFQARSFPTIDLLLWRMLYTVYSYTHTNTRACWEQQSALGAFVWHLCAKHISQIHASHRLQAHTCFGLASQIIEIWIQYFC